MDYFTDEEAMSLISAASSESHWFSLFSTMWETGLRIGEALKVTKKDLYPGGGKVGPEIGIWSEKRSEKIYERVTVSETQFAFLCDYASTIRGQKLWPYTEAGFACALNRFALLAGINRKVHSHMFRHGLAVKLARNLDIPDLAAREVIREALRHTSAQTTEIYLRMTGWDAKKYIRRVLEGKNQRKQP